MLKKTDEITKLFLIGIVFLVMIFYILFTSIGDSKKVDYSFIEKSINNLKDNYTLGVKINNKTITYSRDEKIEVYDSNEFENKTYVKNDKKTYVLKDGKLNEIEINNDLIDRYYYDINLIKSIIPYCNYKKVDNGEVVCSIKIEEYNNELLSMYGIGKEGMKFVNIHFYFENNIVNKIGLKMDNNNININIKNSNTNDYTNYLEMIK